MSARVVLCLAIEGVVLLLVTQYLVFRGWAHLCVGQCDEGEAWIAYVATAALATTIPTVYAIISLSVGRTPLMRVLRVPSLWKARRQPCPIETG